MHGKGQEGRMEVGDFIGIISYRASNSRECLTEQEKKPEQFGAERSVKYRRTNP